MDKLKSNKLLALHDIFLRKFLFLFLTIFILIGIVFYFWLKDIYTEQTKVSLLHNINIVSLQIKNLQDVDNLAKMIKKSINLRVTIISKDGTVLGESDKDFRKMENHLNRAEIIQAKYQEHGSTIRYSTTLKKELLYISKKFKVNKEDYYIRMSRDVEILNQQYFFLSLKVGVLFLIFMILAFSISINISKQVQQETKNILEFLKNLTTQKKAIKIESIYSKEFNKITKLLTTVSENLSKKDKQKSKYTAKLKLSNRQKDDIISAISHEFKNPIAVITGYVQTLNEDKDIHPNIRDKFLHKIATNSEKLTHMIDRLRLAIKLDDGKYSQAFTKCNMILIVNDTIETLNMKYPNRNIDFKHSEIVNVNADETLLNISILNLIENAIKYSEDEIIIELTKTNLSIIDSGIGLSKNDMLKITDKFYRVSNNTWNNSLGLGLSIVKNILDIHNFKLDISSVENEGSTFRIVF